MGAGPLCCITAKPQYKNKPNIRSKQTQSNEQEKG